MVQGTVVVDHMGGFLEFGEGILAVRTPVLTEEDKTGSGASVSHLQIEVLFLQIVDQFGSLRLFRLVVLVEPVVEWLVVLPLVLL